MNLVIVSYSYTGNNATFAEYVARDLSAKHIQIAVQRPVTTGTIIADLVFARTPEVQPAPDRLRQYDLILFFAPIWMGKIASPIRAYLHYLKANPQPYGFLSISGGADGEKPNLSKELLKRTGAKPLILLDQHIRDLIPSKSKPTRQDTSAYQITETEAKRLSDLAVKEIKNYLLTRE